MENNGGIQNKITQLIAGYNTAIFEEIFRKDVNDKLATNENNSDVIHINTPINDNKDQFYFLKKENDSIHILSSLKKRDYDVLDVVPHIEWKLIPNESRQIGSFKCDKATTTFRGAHLSAYYTKEIPLPFGPYKFQGLPGLILAIYQDEAINNQFGPDFKNSWVAINIKYPASDTSISLYETKKIVLKDAEYITYQNFLDTKEKFENELTKRIQATAPVGTTFSPTIRHRYGIEQKYEWEK